MHLDRCSCVGLLHILFLLKVRSFSFDDGYPDFESIFVPNDFAATPTVVLVGTAKAGTTDLYYQLTSQNIESDTFGPGPQLSRGILKEIQKIGDATLQLTSFLSGSSEERLYQDLLSHPCALVPRTEFQYAACHALVTNNFSYGCQIEPRYTIDATPTYLDLAPVAPLLLRLISPNSKVIAILKEPLSRAISHYKHCRAVDGLFEGSTFTTLAHDFFGFINEHEGVRATLERLRKTIDIEETTATYYQLHGLGLFATRARQVFSSGLYRYALAGWLQHFATPGRMLIINSHAYYQDRPKVMAKVVKFLYNRTITQSERERASSTRVEGAGIDVSSSMYVPDNKVLPHLKKFYKEHVTNQMHVLLQQLRDAGAWIVGFDAYKFVN